MTTTESTTEQDPFLFDNEQLKSIADEWVIRQGLADFRDNSVTDLDCAENLLWAQVEERDTQEPLTTEISYDGDGNLSAVCDCGDEEHPVCRHAVAVLAAYASQAGSDDELHGALDTAIEERVKRGRTEVQVEKLGEEPAYGLWRARSIGSASHFPRSYRVHIRSLQRRANYCTCPDFAGNQLGTCKHIEAVLHKIGKRRDYPKLKEQPAPFPYVYLSWDQEDAPRIALYRSRRTPRGLGPVLAEYFDDRGLFKGRLPDDYFSFTQQVEERDDIDLGEDAFGHARQLAEGVAHRSRAEQIRRQIGASGGHLPGVQARLYPYQVEGVAFLAANGRALLADDMGLGKTLQAIAAASWLQNNAQARRILVVCPASLKQQWAREIERFIGMQARIIQGSPEARGVQYRQGDGFYIINYELVLRDLSVINETLSPDLLILDEAQRIKNWRTKIASAIKLIPSRYAFVLSGTPLENRLEDLYSLMQVVDARVLGPLWRYLTDFHITDERGKVQGYRNLSELRRRLAPVMLRRDRRLVSDQLPERIQQRLDLPLTPKQQELHDAAMSAAGTLANIAKRRPLTPGEQNRLMAALQQARMACNAAGLVDKETEGAPKLDELVNLLDELCLQGGRKAVVFSQWALMTEMAEQRLRKIGLGCVRLHGGVPTAKRGDLMDRFREDDAIQVFISTDAGGVGLNLQSASVLINLDIPWNPAVLEQRIARIHRLGQTDKVQVVLLVTSDGYEGRVMELVQGKQVLFDNVIDPDAAEDVVGVSPKLLERLVEDLAETREGATSPDEEAEAGGESTTAVASEIKPPVRNDLEVAITRCVEELQAAFGPRIERILGAGGGLLVVMDRVDEAADRQASQLSERIAEDLSVDVPLALVDPLTLSGLQRLGSASPVQEGETYYSAQMDTKAKESTLLAFAKERLEAAELLVEQSSSGPALELLISALLASAAARAGLAQAPAPEQAGVWLFGEALPQGWLDEAQAALIMRGLSLVQAPVVPDALLTSLLDDSRGFILATV
jgi:superfamily II DNA or RNA helicase